jgi:sirohydrochlorin cobaltochelatase
MLPKSHTALVIVGHGSTLNPDSSQPTYDHAESIRALGVFDEVVCAFWKEEPSMREVLRMVDSPTVYVVPNFISEGYFTQDIIPRELRLSGPETRLAGQTVRYCDPVGIHPSMTKLLVKRMAEVAPGVSPHECSVIIVGHGTGMNDNSTKAIKDQVTAIADLQLGYAEVIDAYMEEAPLVADWATLTTAPNVIVVPFFIADGLHSFQDIPVLLGMETEPTAAASQTEVFRQNPRALQGRQVYYASAIGTEPLLAEVMLDQVDAFDAKHGTLTVAEALETWLQKGGGTLGELSIRAEQGGYVLHHWEDDPGAELAKFHAATEARELAKYDGAGNFRPLKSAPTLKRGWSLHLSTAAQVRHALDYFYPAAVANWTRWQRGFGAHQVVALRDLLNRQTGMYRVTGLITDDEAQQLVANTCQPGCSRKILWPLAKNLPLNAVAPEKTSVETMPNNIPLLCCEACNILVAEARTVVKARMALKKPQ